ncbi:MAG TPA: FUSC family protein [Rudaea sp.]|nr:FUSC family protein [Rudaea sp.]
MPMAVDSAIPGASLFAFLREELAPRPGRVAAAIRITICCTITVVLCMLFQIPAAAYAAYIVFLVSGAETATTLMTAIGGAVAATVAIGFTLLLYMLDAGEPALRIPLMAGATFLAMFLSRVIAIGPIAFLTGFVLVITQTLVDDIPNLDALTHFVLWLWVVVVMPAAMVSLADVAFGQNPARLARDNALRILATVENALRRSDGPELTALTSATATLVELRQRAELLDHSLRARNAGDVSLIEVLDELVRVATMLPSNVAAAARAPLIAACERCREALGHATEPESSSVPLPPDILRELDADARPVVIALASILERLLAGLAQRVHDNARPQTPPTKAFFVADAFSNPEHVRYALKATLAVMLVYIIYSGLAWPEIRTCVVTCFFVALGSIGETIHKLTLRLSGAIAGGLLGGLCIVFVLPHLTDIGGLVLLTAAVAFLCAWVSTSSDRLAYAGMQMAFAFFIGVLQGYGPTEELTVLRDRVLGIVLGNVAMSVVFMTIWPVSAVTQAQEAMAKALIALGGVLRSTSSGTRLAVAQALHRAQRLLSMGIFESGLVEDPHQRSRARETLDDLSALTAATLVVVNQPVMDEADTPWRNAAAGWFEDASQSPPRATPSPLPDDAGVARGMSALSKDTPVALQAALEAKLLLSSVMRSAATHAT